MRARVPRAIVAIFLPALAFQAAFPVMESFTTVYNGPTEFLPSLFLVICLLAGPAIVLAFWVRSNLLFSLGVAVFTLQSLGVAWEIATTDDAQAGLAALELPFYTGTTAVVLVAVDLYLRRRRRGDADEYGLAKSSGGFAADR